MRLVIALCLGLGMLAARAADPAPTPAPTPPKPGAACVNGHFRDFDFWVGQWDVYSPKGKLAGHSRIEKILADCVIAEHWQSNGGSGGKSHNMYDAAHRRWTQFWVDNSGTALLLHGGLQGHAMVLESEQPASGAQPAAIQRITWTPQPDGRVRQHWQSSSDRGQTWNTAFDGWYQKAGTPPPKPTD